MITVDEWDNGAKIIENIDIRESEPGDFAAIEKLYPDAFPEEDLLPLVRELLKDRSDVLSLVATLDSSLVGHVIFTICGPTGKDEEIALLGPLAVVTDRQRQGIGSALVRAGLHRLQKIGVQHVCVLGDPAYYRRLGFAPEARIKPPYELPAERHDAWQSMSLGNAEPPNPGKLSVPEPWRPKALWLP